MLHVDVSVKPSAMHGKGLFIEEDAKKGRLIYTHEPEKKEFYTDEELKQLPEERRKEIRHFAPKVDDKEAIT